jgi:purine-binding chemotaxis protein CheW
MGGKRMSDLQIVVFNLNKEICGAETSQVKQIIKYQETTKIPKMPKFVEGIIVLRNNEIPIINLNKRLEFGETEINKKTKIILTEIENKLIGFIVNDINELMKFTEEEIELLPQFIREAGNGYMNKVVKKDDKIITILDLHTILSESEIKKLNK